MPIMRLPGILESRQGVMAHRGVMAALLVGAVGLVALTWRGGGREAGIGGGVEM